MKTNSANTLSKGGLVRRKPKGSPVRVVDTVQAVEELFADFLAGLRSKLGEEVFSSWFGRLQLEYYSSAIVRLSVPTAFLRLWINSHYMTVLEMLWRELQPQLVRLEIVVRGVAKLQGTQPIMEFSSPTETPRLESKPAQTVSAVSAEVSQQLVLGSPLDPKYVFETFVEGPSNRMALAAAKTVAETESQVAHFNPLFIHASVGLGKTHLLQAIASSALKRPVAVKVVYFTAEYFMWRFAMALRDNNALNLKSQLRDIDLLIIDDMQFLQGKTIQHEFCHLLNLLLDGAKQVVVAADRPVGELEMLDERVRSRLQGGVAFEIASPDYQMRMQILTHRLSQATQENPDLHIDPELLSFVAKSITGSGRDLDGAFNQLLVSQALGGDLSMAKVTEVLGHLLQPSDNKRIKIEDIQRVVARHYNVSKQDLLSNRRTRTIVKPRQVAMYLSKNLTPRSLPEIGRRFGGRDHTTVLHAVRKIETLLDTDQPLRSDIELLKQYIQDQAV